MFKIVLYSRRHHLKQILTGFHSLCQKTGEKMKIVDCSNDPSIDTIACIVHYNGKRIAYDSQDGYQDPESMEKLLQISDYYFKRSFSREENRKLRSKIQNPDDVDKIQPLGFYYNVTYQWSPLNSGTPWKEHVKRMLGYKNTENAYFNTEAFEGKPDYSGNPPKIFFQTRLWENEDSFPDWKKEQRIWINNTRVEIVRRLKKEFGDLFIGGIADDPIAHEVAPDLIISRALTDRKAYLSQMKSSDICIGTTGLHMSIGSKMGEYIAAARAIVHENMYYSVIGDFAEGKNYLAFSTVDECIDSINYLISRPELILEMQRNNFEYYREYLEPSQLIIHSLRNAGIDTF